MSLTAATVAFHSGQVSGPLRSLEAELRWLSESHRLEILVPGGAPVAPDFERLGGELVRSPHRALGLASSPAAALRDARRLGREVRWFRSKLRGRALALAVTTTLPAFVLAARLEGVPTIVYAGELWRGAGRGVGREAMGRALVATEGRIASGVLACSAPVARQFPASANVVEMPPAVGEQYAGGDGPGFRRRHAIDPGAPLIASVGSITAGRGQDLLLGALPALRDRHPGLRCAIVGEPFAREADLEFDRRLEALAGAPGAETVVLRVPRVDAIADLYAAAEVIVNPATAHPETFGRVAFEAGIAGTPSVLAATGVTAELHTDGATALLVEPGAPETLAAAVQRLLADPELGARLAAGAAALARRVASPERSLAAFRRLVEQLDG